MQIGYQIVPIKTVYIQSPFDCEMIGIAGVGLFICGTIQSGVIIYDMGTVSLGKLSGFSL